MTIQLAHRQASWSHIYTPLQCCKDWNCASVINRNMHLIMNMRESKRKRLKTAVLDRSLVAKRYGSDTINPSNWLSSPRKYFALLGIFAASFPALIVSEEARQNKRAVARPILYNHHSLNAFSEKLANQLISGNTPLIRDALQLVAYLLAYRSVSLLSQTDTYY